jgi:Lanthionine synthetase C-like protein
LAETALYDAERHEPLTSAGWDEDVVRARIAEIVADAEAAVDRAAWEIHPRDAGDDLMTEQPTTLYLGAAGMIWALRTLGTSLGLVQLAAETVERYPQAPDFGEDVPDLHFGATGVLLVAHLVGVGDVEHLLRARIRENVHNQAWELMSGSAGSIIAARAAGLDAEADSCAAVLEAEWDDTTGLWTQTLEGKVSQFIGPAHGLAGNVHALRGFLSDDQLRERIEPTLRRYAHVGGGLANWPPRVGDQLTRVQWCHGAAGIVATLGDLMPHDLLLGGAELTWRAGPVAQGAGLCHGTAGNGYAFLKTYAVTGDDVWLERARRFAMHALEQAEGGQGRYTLFTGDIGAALFARSCLTGDARFPTMDVW